MKADRLVACRTQFDEPKFAGLPRLHLNTCFATLTRASRAIRKDPATEQETVPGAAVTKHPDVQKLFASETARSPNVLVRHLSLMRLVAFDFRQG